MPRRDGSVKAYLLQPGIRSRSLNHTIFNLWRAAISPTSFSPSFARFVQLVRTCRRTGPCCEDVTRTKEWKLASWHLFSFRVSGPCRVLFRAAPVSFFHGPLFRDLGFLNEAIREMSLFTSSKSYYASALSYVRTNKKRPVLLVHGGTMQFQVLGPKLG